MIDFLRVIVVPSGLCAVLFVAGLLAMLPAATRRFARPLFMSSGSLLLAFSFGPVATLLLAPLEYEYPAMTKPEYHATVKTIVLLTAYASDDPVMPLSSRMNSSSAFRVLETANLVQRRPDCRILISGGEIAARVMSRQFQAMGVAPDRIVLEVNSRNTAESAANIAHMVGNEPVFLVTSAGHMRRSLAVFARQGITAVAVPADHQLPSEVSKAEWAISPFNLGASDLAMHEYAGLLWYRITGRI